MLRPLDKVILRMLWYLLDCWVWYVIGKGDRIDRDSIAKHQETIDALLEADDSGGRVAREAADRMAQV